MTVDTAQKLVTVDEFKAMKADVKSRLAKLSSNCLLGEATVAAAIESGRAYYEKRGEGLLLYVDEDAYWRLLYYLDPEADFPAVRSEKPIVLEELDSGGRRLAYLTTLRHKLESAGWELMAQNVQVSVDISASESRIAEALASASQRLEGAGVSVRDCIERDVPSVQQLWREHLRDTDVPGDHLDFFQDESQHVVCAVDRADHVCGVNWWAARGGTCEIRHTVTDPAHYHQGIGYALLLTVLRDAGLCGCRRAFTYIDENNLRSLGLYEKAGLVPNGKTSTQFILRGDASSFVARDLFRRQ